MLRTSLNWRVCDAKDLLHTLMAQYEPLAQEHKDAEEHAAGGSARRTKQASITSMFAAKA